MEQQKALKEIAKLFLAKYENELDSMDLDIFWILQKNNILSLDKYGMIIFKE